MTVIKQVPFYHTQAQMQRWHFQRCTRGGILKRCVMSALLMACLCALKAAWHFPSGSLAVWFGFVAFLLKFNPLLWILFSCFMCIYYLQFVMQQNELLLSEQQVHIPPEGERDYMMSWKNTFLWLAVFQVCEEPLYVVTLCCLVAPSPRPFPSAIAVILHLFSSWSSFACWGSSKHQRRAWNRLSD